MHFTHGSSSAHALVTQVGGAHPMETQQEGFGIPQAAGRGDLRLIARSPEPTQQAGLSTTLQWGKKRQGAGLLKLLTKNSAGEQEGHWTRRSSRVSLAAVPLGRVESWGMVVNCAERPCPSASRASGIRHKGRHWRRPFQASTESKVTSVTPGSVGKLPAATVSRPSPRHRQVPAR